MAVKHTPGPWFFEGFVETENSSGWFVTVAPKRSISVEGRSADEAMANARLIAAAPDLLEALEAFNAYAYAKACETDGMPRYSYGEIWRLAFRARAAILKATGEA